MNSTIKLFPTVIACSLCVLAVKVVSLSSGFSVLENIAVAQEEAPAENAGNGEANPQEQGGSDEKTQSPDNGQTTGNESVQPLVIGLPPDEEMKILLSLGKRREELDSREQKLDVQEQLLASTEKRIETKIAELKKMEVAIQEALGEYDVREKKKMDSIVKVYETMKPKDAARVFEQLTLNIQLDVATRMKSKNVAAILAKMDPVKASVLTTRLATYAKPPSYDSVKSK